jgi:hypothetical protein
MLIEPLFLYIFSREMLTYSYVHVLYVQYFFTRNPLCPVFDKASGMVKEGDTPERQTATAQGAGDHI